MTISVDSPIFLAFESRAIAEIEKGKKHLSAKLIVEKLRDETPITDGSTGFKIDNRVTARLSEMFDQLHPEYKGYFKHRQGPFKTETWGRSIVSRDDFGTMDTDTNGQGRFA